MKPRLLFLCITMLLLLSHASTQSLFYPIDATYYPDSGYYFVSDWAEGTGKIARMNPGGQITDTLFYDLKYAGGLCLVGDTLYVLKNYGKFTVTSPGYLIGFDLATGNEICNKLIVADGYLDLVTYDFHGMLYITDEENNKLYRYNIAQGTADTFVSDDKFIFGVCYDSINDRILYTSSSFYWSDIKSIPRTGGTVNTLFSRLGYIEGMIMDEQGNFYYSSWGGDYEWGNEPVFKNSSTFTYEDTISAGLNRPFGLCLGPGNTLVVCNWGGHSVEMIDLSPFSVFEEAFQPYQAILSPNPCHDQCRLKLTGAIHEPVLLKLFDAGGQVVYNEHIMVESAGDHHALPVGRLDAGVYCLVISGQRGSTSLKLLVE
jgi:sugar lactone lactonase YvrE